MHASVYVPVGLFVNCIMAYTTIGYILGSI